MSNVVKLGPLWNRVSFDRQANTVKHRGRTLARLEDVAAFRVVEYIAQQEEVELQNRHPDVQKAPREAELWLDLKDGRAVPTLSMERVGLLLEAVSPLATALNKPIKSERRLVEDAAKPR